MRFGRKQRRPDRPLVFVCSPYRGDMETNTQNARRYCRLVVERGGIPFAPHLLFTQFLNEDKAVERRRGLRLGMEMNSPALPLMILMSCTAKQSSMTTDATALSSSSSLLTSLIFMLLSCISLLLKSTCSYYIMRQAFWQRFCGIFSKSPQIFALSGDREFENAAQMCRKQTDFVHIFNHITICLYDIVLRDLTTAWTSVCKRRAVSSI